MSNFKVGDEVYVASRCYPFRGGDPLRFYEYVESVNRRVIGEIWMGLPTNEILAELDIELHADVIAGGTWVFYKTKDVPYDITISRDGKYETVRFSDSIDTTHWFLEREVYDDFYACNKAAKSLITIIDPRENRKSTEVVDNE